MSIGTTKMEAAPAVNCVTGVNEVLSVHICKDLLYGVRGSFFSESQSREILYRMRWL